MARKYVVVSGRRIPLKTAAERRASRAGAPARVESSGARVGVPIPTVSDVRHAPSRVADMAVGNPAAAILVMMFLLAMLDFLRAGANWSAHPFTRRRVTGYFLAGFGFLLLATVAPDLARVIVFGILLLTALSMAGPIAAVIDSVVARLNERPTGSATAPRPV